MRKGLVFKKTTKFEIKPSTIKQGIPIIGHFFEKHSFGPFLSNISPNDPIFRGRKNSLISRWMFFANNHYYLFLKAHFRRNRLDDGTTKFL